MIIWTDDKIAQLKDLYFEKEMSFQACASEIGVSVRPVRAALYRFFGPLMKERSDVAKAARAALRESSKTTHYGHGFRYGWTWSDAFKAAAGKRGIACASLARRLLKEIEREPDLIDAILDDEHHPQPFKKDAAEPAQTNAL